MRNNDLSYTGITELDNNSQWLPRYNRDTARLMASSSIKEIQKPCKSLISNGVRIKILDFGAGIGTLTLEMAKLFEHCEFICIEPDQRLRAKIPEWAITAPSIQPDMIGQIDFAFSSNVLEHIEDDVEALRKLGETLNEDGKIAIYVPALLMLWTRMDDKVGHLRRYTLESLTRTARLAGLNVDKIAYIDSMGALATLIYKIQESLTHSRSYRAPSASMLRLYDNIIWPLSLVLDRITGKIFGKNLIMFASKSKRSG
jgi:SAM-dependent methyltransferase